MSGTITISFGPSNTVEKPLDRYSRMSTILSCPNLQQELGFGSNVEGRVNGAGGIENLQAGDSVTIVNRANTKGI